jgi:hypothetical protein
MRQFKWAVATAATTSVLLTALWIQPAAVAAPKGKTPPVVGEGPCLVIPRPACKGNYRPVCVRGGRLCGHRACLEWTCRELNPKTKEPLKPPNPLPGSRLR